MMIKEKNTKKDFKQSFIEYRLDEIQIVKFNLTEVSGDDLDINEIQMGLNVNGKFNEGNKEVEINVTVIISKKNKNNSFKKIGELKVKYLFLLKGIENMKENGKTYLPKDLLNVFNRISISTTRGILFTKFQGTKINKFILPLIDHTKFQIDYEEI